MAAIDDLIRQVGDAGLRRQLQREAETLQRQKKFGLVYEEHIPECVLLPGVAIRRGSTVARRDGDINMLFQVESIEGAQARCRSLADGKEERIRIEDLVAVARFGEAVYPYLQPVDNISTANPSEPWHTLIEADNYHALQLLDYLYHGQVDCIYIDPPYNSGARDWKYNNNYVDASDQYRHSKWLSMMEKRLRLAKRLLNPKDSVLIVTIDEKEYLHLGCLLEEMFPEARIQMVSDTIHPSGVARTNQFSRVDEYIFFLAFGNASPALTSDSMLYFEMTGNYGMNAGSRITWRRMIRAGSNSLRTHSENCFYPINVDANENRIISVGYPLGRGVDRHTYIVPDGCIAVWPIHQNGHEGVWQVGRDTLIEALKNGTARLGKRNRFGGWAMNYLSEGMVQEIERGEITVEGRDENGALILRRSENKLLPAKTIWNKKAHDATQFGSYLIKDVLGDNRFPYPKSLYAVHDTLRFFVANKPDALILDFFAGSGTTLHAVNLLNKEDGGRRRCIMVTNNEVSYEEAKQLRKQGYKPGDDEWERLGIARYVTWPRTTCSILGKDVNDKPIQGEYLTYLTEEKSQKRIFKQLSFYIPQGNDGTKLKKQIVMLLGKDKLPQSKVTDDRPFIVDEDYPVAILFDDKEIAEWLDAIEEQDHLREFYIVTQNNKLFKRAKERIEETLGDYTMQETVKYPMQDGFLANVEYFKLGFLDKTAVSLGRQFREVLPLLWLKAGAKGKRPEVAEGDDIPAMLIVPESDFAVLTDETQFGTFAEQLEQHKDIGMVFIVTDSATGFAYMNNELAGRQVVQLYKNYLDNFTINQTSNIR